MRSRVTRLVAGISIGIAMAGTVLLVAGAAAQAWIMLTRDRFTCSIGQGCGYYEVPYPAPTPATAATLALTGLGLSLIAVAIMATTRSTDHKE